MNKFLFAAFAVGFSLFACTRQTNRNTCADEEFTLKREAIFEKSKLPPLVTLPVPQKAISLPKNWAERNEPVSIQLSQPPVGKLLVRRVSNNDGKLYLEIYCPEGEISGNAEVKMGKKTLGKTSLNGSLWLSLKPRIGKIEINVLAADDKIQLAAPTTLVEVRGRQIFLNGEPFIMKGATGSPGNPEIADYLHTIGFNLLRGRGSYADGEKYGFMGLVSLNFGGAPVDMFRADDDVFEQGAQRCLDWLKENSADAIDSPNALILQLGNERSPDATAPPSIEAVDNNRRHVSQLLVAARNLVKPKCPMMLIGYANQDMGYLTPDCFDVYMHNSFLHKDRYEYTWEDFLKWQGCVPPYGTNGEGRPFVNSEFGANRYLPQSYHGGPNNPVLEKIHAWNLTNRWDEFMEHGTVGGAIFNLADHNAPIDQGCSRFGILTDERKVKLACWDVGLIWRDFTVETNGKNLLITYKPDYFARDCRLTITPVNGKPVQIELKDFSPRSKRTISLKSLRLGVDDAFRWRMDFTTHSGLVNAAAGACPVTLAEQDFLALIRERDTAPFLTELFDAEVLTADGNPAPQTLVEMTDSQGIIPVILHKPNGVAYLVPISRENPNTDAGQIKEGINLEIAFKGRVEIVDDMTGEPLPDEVIATTSIANGLRLTNIKAARIPGPIGKRSDTPFMMPIYRITPETQ